MVTQKQLHDFKEYLEKKYPTFIILELDTNVRKQQYVILGLFEVLENNRNKGFGTSIMYELIDFSNKNKIPIALTPTHFFNSNVERLIKFYKKFGFIINEDKETFYEKMSYIPN
jgi:GNAT superfamily N-acetyltransferase